MSSLDVISARSKTSRLCVENLVKAVFIALNFVRAERGVDWPLHLIQYIE